MSYEFRSPNVTGADAGEQAAQLLSFLRQHIQQLNWVVKSLEGAGERAASETQRQELLEAVGQSAQVTKALSRNLRQLQARENFLGCRKEILKDVRLETGDQAAAEEETVKRYSLFLALMEDGCAVCGREGSRIQGAGVRLGLDKGRVTVEECDTALTGLYGII